MLDRLVDIDPYDYRNQERISKLEGKVDPAFIAEYSRARGQGGDRFHAHRRFFRSGFGRRRAAFHDEGRAQQALEDLIVQVEIFLQYSLQAKAIERLERLAQAYPGEEDRNERLRALYERANWWPKGVAPKPAPKVPLPAAGACSALRPNKRPRLRFRACSHGRGNQPRPCRHCRNQPADVPAGHPARSACGNGGASRQASWL